MSLLIKGMEMPKNCKDCPCREYGKFSYEPDWCCLNRKNIVNAETISPNCPLSEIPTPHGRLIDADALLSRLNGIKYAANVEDWISRKPIFADGLEEEIISAPTIIEAEE